MARSRRRRFSTPRSRKSASVRPDWVYRANARPAYNPAGAAIMNGDTMGTYGAAETTVSQQTAAAKWLYDSHNHHVVIQRMEGAAPNQILTTLSRAGRAEGGKATILCTSGVILMRASAWAVGSRRTIGYRMGIFEQAPDSGAMALDPNYSLWANFGNTQPADWANMRNWVWERRIFEDFGAANNLTRTVSVFWKGRRTLKPHEGWGLFIEGGASSVDCIQSFWLRTLVVDEG